MPAKKMDAEIGYGKHYLYIHYRNDTGVPFYVGIGTKLSHYENISTDTEVYKRAYNFFSRNRIWNNIYKKTNKDITIKIISESDNYEYICNKEKEFISLYGKIVDGGILSNISDGGEAGSFGITLSDDHKKQIAKQMIGNINGGSRVIHVDSLEVFECIEDARKAYYPNKKPGYLNHLLRKNNISPFVYVEDYEKFGLDYCKTISNKETKGKKKVINIETLEMYESSAVVARLLFISNAAMCLMLNGKNPNKTQFVYYDTYLENGEEYCKSITNEKSNSSKKCINTNTGEIFNSYSEAALTINMPITAFSRRMIGTVNNKTYFKPL